MGLARFMSEHVVRSPEMSRRLSEVLNKRSDIGFHSKYFSMVMDQCFITHVFSIPAEVILSVSLFPQNDFTSYQP